jgi:hypothetical protein
VLGIKRNRIDGDINVRIAWSEESDRQAPLPTYFPLSYIKNKEQADELLLEYFEDIFGVMPPKRMRMK